RSNSPKPSPTDAGRSLRFRRRSRPRFAQSLPARAAAPRRRAAGACQSVLGKASQTSAPAIDVVARLLDAETIPFIDVTAEQMLAADERARRDVRLAFGTRSATCVISCGGQGRLRFRSTGRRE